MEHGRTALIAGAAGGMGKLFVEASVNKRVAGTVLFPASPAADFIAGRTLVVDDGLHMA